MKTSQAIKKDAPCSDPSYSYCSDSMQWILGMILSSVFSLVYLITPTYFILAAVCAIFQYPTRTISFAFASPILFSALFTKPMNGSPALFRWLLPMLHYFSYEEILECSTEKLFQSKRPYIIACQPHGVVRNCSIFATSQFIFALFPL